jgi:hypothetical protein
MNKTNFNTMSNTPRTDACYHMIINSDACHADDIITACDFARTLEVELAEARKLMLEVKQHHAEGIELMKGAHAEIEKLTADLAAKEKTS